MDIRVKEPLYAMQHGSQYVVRPGTVGVEKNKIVYFYDVTKTVAVGVSRDFCLENPQIFQLSKTLSDKDIPLRDIRKVIESKLGQQPTLMQEIINELESL